MRQRSSLNVQRCSQCSSNVSPVPIPLQWSCQLLSSLKQSSSQLKSVLHMGYQSIPANNDVCNSWAAQSGLVTETSVHGSKLCKDDAVLPVNSDTYKPEIGHSSGCKDCYNFSKTMTQILNASELLSSGLLKQICESDKEMTAAAKKMCAHVIKEVLLPALDATSTFMSYEVLCKQITGECKSNIEK
uniref:Saposin B-type domain-containing protein n=1 Tax=Ditylenchus dipsaci TaxID=166011 RepID=A0A915D2A7_9BILA